LWVEYPDPPQSDQHRFGLLGQILSWFGFQKRENKV
jgi:hypothetical protein